ncbi:MAG TPA: hypothetical protein VHX38_14595 [Pseudonocardiaceae bacterium]|nr:hypothetical protein [Pseudonocardiaceae bacterium]
MTVAKTPVRQSLPYAIAGLVVIGIAVFALWLLSGLSGLRGSTPTDTTAQATVLTQVSCQAAQPYDAISAQVAGHPLALKLNGCGHSAGTRLTVLVPAGATEGTLVDQSAAAPGTATGLSHRVAFLLLVVSAAAGGFFGYLLYRQRTEPAADGARPASDKPERAPRSRWGRHTGTQPKLGLTPEQDSSPMANDDLTGTNWFTDSGISPALDPEQAVDHADKA